MPITKQGVEIPFGSGIDTKTDAKLVSPMKMLSLVNAVFQSGDLSKRNGYKQITALPAGANSLATYSDGLVALGQTLQAYNAPNNQWLNKGSVPSIDLKVSQIGRTNVSQISSDIAIAPSGLACVTYQDSTGCYYQFMDVSNNEIIVLPVLISATATMPRVVVTASYYIVSYLDTITSTPHLRYIAIPIGNLLTPRAAADVSTSVAANPTGYDAVVANNQVYYAWNGSDGGGAIRITLLSTSLVVSSPVIIAGSVGNIISIVVDGSGSLTNIWILFYTSGTTTLYATCYSSILTAVLAPTAVQIATMTEFTGVASAGLLTFYTQNTNTYTYDGSIRTDFLGKNTINTAGTIGTGAVMARGLGLGSRAFTYNSTNYMLGIYGQASTTSQPSYFLIDDSGNLVCKLAYSNGAGYLTSTILSNISQYDGSFILSYLFRTQLVPVSKDFNQPGAVNGIYSQNGVNLARFTFDVPQYSAEIGGALHITGGALWMYDGSNPVEHGFNLWPENIEVTTATGSGALAAQQYAYQFCYEWTDLKGNIHRSAPSIPVLITTTTSASTNTVNVPTLRLTNKKNVRLVGYRWSAAQETFYQFTSISSPTINNKGADSIAVTDALSDAAILGNPIIYTTGGTLENIGAPACSVLTLYKSRLILLTCEDRNLIWFSKQVIEATPVELTDLLTEYAAPTIASQNSTGDVTALSSMDDKIILFKESAVYYITGSGPDNTGANNDFSDPVFINSTVGCTNQASIVFSPNGLMFQSNKGIWLLGRDLSTPYIGADVEAFNTAAVESAISVPNTTQVRFTLDSGTTLMYDYYYNQWGTFEGIPGISSTVYENLHTYLDANNRIFQETIDAYLDGSNPVLLSLTTSWIKLTGVQGFQRAYFVYLIGRYITPHKLNFQVAYDYNPAIAQSSLITPINYSPAWGGDAFWGSGSPWGGPSSLEQWRVFMRQQKCQSVQVTIDEIYDPSFGVAAGAGLAMTGLNFVIGAKRGYARIGTGRSVG